MVEYVGEEKIPCAKRTYSDEQYKKMVDYITSHNDKYCKADFEDDLQAIINNDYIIYSKYLNDGKPERIRCGGTAFSEKNHILRAFKEVIRNNNDEKAFQEITGKILHDDTFYLSCKTGVIAEKECDFYSLDIIYLLPTNSTKDDIKKNLQLMRRNAYKKCYQRLNRSRFKGIQEKFLDVKRVIWRKNFSELVITMGLRQDIIELKESMTTEIERHIER